MKHKLNIIFNWWRGDVVRVTHTRQSSVRTLIKGSRWFIEQATLPLCQIGYLVKNRKDQIQNQNQRKYTSLRTRIHTKVAVPLS